MANLNFDIAIIGAGAAGLHLALAMHNDPYFSDKRILILEKTAKDQNDRTWCFWEKGEGLWDDLIQQSWSQGDFYYKEKAVPLSLTPYRYKMLRSIDFYKFAKKKISAHSMFNWVEEDVQSVVNDSPLQINGLKSVYTAEIVFDSRIPNEFMNTVDSYTRLLQHFRGWVIKTNDDVFDSDRFTMMDFRLVWPATASFTYVLPLSKREALVEFTLFSSSLLQKNDYELMLQNYIRDILKLKDYEIVEHEQGIIPMSDFPFENYSKGNHIRIGTGGGWVKPSTGYSFKNCERNSRKLIANLKLNKYLNDGLLNRKFRIYDTLFLDVLYRQNHLGPALFKTMYTKIPVQTIFSFLDNQTNFRQDLSIIFRFPWMPFLFSAIKKFSPRWNKS
jgi:lycopene beta-cyclase